MSQYVVLKRKSDGREILDYNDNKGLFLSNIIGEIVFSEEEKGFLNYNHFMSLIAHVAEEVRSSAAFSSKLDEQGEPTDFYDTKDVIIALINAAQWMETDDEILFILC